jgi:dephospho-CoA kinase
LTDEELKRRGLERNEKNERIVREDLRKQYGMAVYAIKVAEKIDKIADVEIVVLDGVRSHEEYQYLEEKYGEDFFAISIMSSAETRHGRLEHRKVRPLSEDECESRDASELEVLNHGSTIAEGEYYIINDNISRVEFKKKVLDVFDKILKEE